MLKQLLGLLADGTPYQPEMIAKRLNVSPEMVEAMMKTLERRGYLRNTETCASTKCNQCHLSSACDPAGRRFWIFRRKAS